jgi:YbbR domain-containing protein
MTKWFKRREVVLRFLSLVLAFVLWFLVNEPTLPFALNQDSIKVTGVHVETRYDASKFQLVNMINKVNLVLIGDKQVINQLPAYRVYVDLTKLPAGKHKAIPVKVEGLPTNVKVRSTPANISVELAEKAVRDVPVTIGTNHALPDGYQLLSMSYQPTSVQVYGIKQEVDQVANISASINLSNLRQTTNSTIPLSVHSRTKVRPNVRMVPDKVRATIGIERIGSTVPLSVSILKPPPNGYRVDSITVSPPKIKLYGSSEDLAKFKTYLGVSLDLSQITSNTKITQDVAIVTPIEKVTPTKVEIYVKISRTAIF